VCRLTHHGFASLVTIEAAKVRFPILEDNVFAALTHEDVEDSGSMPRLRDARTSASDRNQRVPGSSPGRLTHSLRVL
jgi:hypothetical protein